VFHVGDEAIEGNGKPMSSDTAQNAHNKKPLNGAIFLNSKETIH
jgi:hypothetical protein